MLNLEILIFENYKNTKIIRLEKNYRSTQNILNVASKLIENNQNRGGKTLYTNQEGGELITLDCFRNVKDEAIEISTTIENYKKNTIKPLILFLILTPFIITFFWPYLWQDPLGNFITIFKSLSNFDENIYNFYLGQYISAKNLPWHYPIVWIFISTPPFYTILFIVGFVFMILRFMRRVFKIEENDYYNNFWKGKKELQDLIFFFSFIIPLFLVIALNSTLYNGWRHLYFIYPSFLMMSLLGLHIIKILFFKKNKNLLLILSFLLLLPTITWMFKYHPYQNVYFNILAGKDFNNKFELDYWGLSNVNALKYIAENGDGDINVSRVGLSDLHLSKAFLSKKYRNKFAFFTPALSLLIRKQE